MRELSNVFIVKYEDLYKTTENVVRNLVKFLGKSFTDKQIETVVRLSSLDSLRGKSDDLDKMMENVPEGTPHPFGINQKISPFFRKGSINDWQNYFTEKQNAFIEKEIQEMREASGLEFDYE